MRTTLRFNILTGVMLSLMLPGFVSPAWAQPKVLNLISEIQGDVRLKRSEWNRYQKANVGDFLNPSDQLKLSAGASARVVCDNLRDWVVPAGKVSLVSGGCGSRQPIQTRPNRRRRPSRNSNKKIPYIISPRDTALLTNRPILRWNAVPGATRYKVRVQDASFTFDWQTETSNTEIEYSGPPLQPDFSYRVIVPCALRPSSCRSWNRRSRRPPGGRSPSS
ncbi:MAG: hypothetical protein F6K65_33480, partial [Moorea sp. SIO3C2]|nr:hypothetical protein [Moorena sp. SIO3C2]